MELQFRSRNHDIGAYFPTRQERMNAAASAAPALDHSAAKPKTPHYPTNEEIRQTLAQVEEEATRQNEELIQMHSGLNEQRVARLLGLLD